MKNEIIKCLDVNASKQQCKIMSQSCNFQNFCISRMTNKRCGYVLINIMKVLSHSLQEILKFIFLKQHPEAKYVVCQSL